MLWNIYEIHIVLQLEMEVEMSTLCFHLQPQYNMNFLYISHHFTSFHCTGKYELNKLTLLLMCGFTAQLVEHRNGIAEVTGSNPVEALIFFWLLPSDALSANSHVWASFYRHV